MTSLNDQIRLEVLATTSGNAITNHSAQAGATTGWALIDAAGNTGWTANGSVNAASGLAFGYGGKAVRARGDAAGSGTKGIIVGLPTFPIVGNQYANVALTLKSNDLDGRDLIMGIQYFNASSAKIGEAVWSGSFRQLAAGAEQTYTLDGAMSGTGRKAPSGTTSARAFMLILRNSGVTLGAQDTYLYKAMVVTGSTDASVAGPVFSDVPETWQNLLPESVSHSIVRGGDVDGVTDNLDVGMMTSVLTDPSVTPANNDRVRPGRPIRLVRSSDGSPVFRGKINQASTKYEAGRPVVTISATDAWADLENFAQPIGRSGRFKQRVDSAMLNVPIAYTVTDTAADTAQATISVADSGTALSQLKLIRDSLRGLAYVDRSNTLRAIAGNSYPSTTPTVTLSDSNADTTAIKYLKDGIVTSFDSKNLVNTLTVTKSALSEPNGQKVYGPYVNQASANAWGTISANVEVNDGTPSLIAAAFLATYAQPTIFTEEVTFDATDDISLAVARELYEAARVKYAVAGVDANYRVIGIEHQITPDAWRVTLRFKPLETTTTITVTNPPGGAASGPADLAPFTREIQTGTVSITATASDVPRSGPVTFPKPYESAPRVFVAANSALPYTRIREVTVTSITATGCDVWLTDATNGTARSVQWVAIPS